MNKIFDFKKLLSMIKNMDKTVSKIVNKGLHFSFGICLIGLFVLIFYRASYISHQMLEAAIILFQTGLLFAIQFFACGIGVDTIKKLNSSN